MESKGNRSGASDYCQYATRGACILIKELAWKHTPTALCILCPALSRETHGLVASIGSCNFGVVNLAGHFSGDRHVEWRLEDVHVGLHICTGRLACVRLCWRSTKFGRQLIVIGLATKNISTSSLSKLNYYYAIKSIGL
jgi:hypothetical protein